MLLRLLDVTAAAAACRLSIPERLLPLLLQLLPLQQLVRLLLQLRLRGPRREYRPSRPEGLKVESAARAGAGGDKSSSCSVVSSNQQQQEKQQQQ